MRNLLVLYSLILSVSFSFGQEKRTYSVYFETAQHELTKDEENKLDAFLDKVEYDKIQDVTIFGYTDDVGTSDYNKKLSNRRAGYIQEYLVSTGVSEDFFKKVDGKGEIVLKKADDIETDIERGYNRKVLIEVTLKQINKKIDESLIEYKFSQGLKVGDVITLENILFREGYATVKSESFKHLRSLAALLQKHDNIYIEIRGHVCCTRFGRDAIDRKTKKRNLSTARAKYVYDFLAKRKISKHRMRYKGLRRKFPLGIGDEFDRRVEIVIVTIGKKREKKQ